MCNCNWNSSSNGSFTNAATAALNGGGSTNFYGGSFVTSVYYRVSPCYSNGGCLCSQTQNNGTNGTVDSGTSSQNGCGCGCYHGCGCCRRRSCCGNATTYASGSTYGFGRNCNRSCGYSSWF